MASVHGPLYWLRIQSTEPSDIETDVIWVDTSDSPASVKRRTAGSTWETIVSGGSGGGGGTTETFEDMVRWWVD